jgi:hypothetical protein
VTFNHVRISSTISAFWGTGGSFVSTSQSDALLKLRRQLLRSTTFWRPENMPDGTCLLWEVGVLRGGAAESADKDGYVHMPRFWNEYQRTKSTGIVSASAEGLEWNHQISGGCQHRHYPIQATLPVAAPRIGKFAVTTGTCS